MSQFPAQIAITPQAQAARRNLPVDLPAGTGVSVVQPAAGAAPGVPGVAPMPTPVPDLSAARDLEQALRATNALGSTLIQTGNALNIQRQIDDRRAITQARMAAEKAEAQMLLDFQGGKLNNAIDATDDIEAFKGSWSDRWFDPRRTEPPQPGDALTVAEADYRERIGRVAQQMYVKRRGELQQQQFSEDIRGVHVGLVDPTSVGPQPDAETLWNEFSQRYPWLDRATFMEASYGKALEALATAGDQRTFEQVAAGITSDRDRTILVDPLVDKLTRSAAANVTQRLQAAQLSLKEATESTAPFASRFAQLNDRLESLVDDDAMRESVRVEFLAGEITRAANVQQMNAAEEVANQTLSDEGKAEFARLKAAQMKPTVTKFLKAQAMDPSSDYASVRNEAAGIVDPDDLATSDATRVRTVRDARKQAVQNTYMKENDRAAIEDLILESFQRYDPSRPQVEQVQDAISPDEALDLMDELDRIDASRKDVATAEDVMSRRMVIPPGAPAWDKVMAQVGAVRNGRVVDPVAAAMVVQQTQTVPSKMIDAVYADLRSPSRDEVKRGVRFLAALAPALSDPAIASRINGFSLSQTDASANAATVLAINSTLPLLSGLQRGQDGSVSEQDIEAATEAFSSTLKGWQESQPPAFDQKRFEDHLRGANIATVGGISTTDSQTNTITVSSYRNAVKTAAANELAKQGLDVTAAAELADKVSSRMLADTMPTVGNVGLSKEVVERRLADNVAMVRAAHHLPTVGGRGFASPAARDWAPRAEWDEQAATAKLAEQGIAPESITHVMPAIGEGNTWWILVSDKGRGRNAQPTTRFVQVDLEVAPIAQQLSPQERMEKALEGARARQQQRSVVTPKDLSKSGIAPFLITP